MQKVDITELRRLHEAATKGENWQEAAMFTEACKLALPALLDEMEAARLEMRRQGSVIAECKEEVRELKADYQRLEEIRRDLMERCERMRSIDGLPLDEIAARQITRDRHMKLIGAAAELERLANNTSEVREMYLTEEFYGLRAFSHELLSKSMKDRAAQLRREAEDGK